MSAGVCVAVILCVFLYDSIGCIDRNLCLQVCGSYALCVFLYDSMSCIDRNLCLQVSLDVVLSALCSVGH